MDVSAARELEPGARAERPGTGPADIRPAGKDELSVIASLFPPALDAYRGSATDEMLDAYLSDLVGGVEPRWEVGETYVAVRDGAVVGSVVFYPDVALEGWSNLPAGWAGFRALVVHPEARGMGVGRDLVQRCVARGRDVGARVLGIHTADILREAVCLYERLGFVRCPAFDLPATAAFPVEAGEGVVAIAFRYDL